MPKLYSIKSREVFALVKRLGYEFDHASGSHHIFKHLETKKIIVIPFHKKDLRIGTVKSIIRELGVSQEWFLENI